MKDIPEDNDNNFILMSFVLKSKYDYTRARIGKEAEEIAGKDSASVAAHYYTDGVCLQHSPPTC